MSEAPEDLTVETPAPDASTSPAADLEAAAREGGWKGKDEFTGDPDNWLDAPQFVLNAAKILPEVSKQLKELKEENKGFRKTVTESAGYIRKAEQRAYERAKAELQADHHRAVQAGDVTAAAEALDGIVDLERQGAAPAAEAGDHPDFVAFREDNDWYGKDRGLTGAFDAICTQVATEGYATPKIGLKEALSRLKADFPEKFRPATNPNRNLPGSVESGGGPRGRGKGFNDMSHDAQEMCRFFEKSVPGFKRDQYVRDHFKDQKQ